MADRPVSQGPTGAAREAEAQSPRAAALLARMEAVPFSGWHARARIVMGSATFLDAFDALSLAFALPVLVKLWGISPAQVGVLIGASYVGQLAGALFFSAIAERRGRVPSATGAVLLMSIMSLGCALVGSFPALLVCRLAQGVGIGGEMPVAAAYISELSRAQGRGRYFLLYEMIFPVGLAATGQVGAWLVPIFGWQAILLAGGVPGLIVAFALARLPESPRWLIARGRLDEAERIVAQIEASTDLRVLPGEPPAAPVPDRRAPDGTAGPTAVAATGWRALLSPAYRSRTLIVWVLWACAYFVTNSLNNWMPTLYSTVYQLPLRTALRAASMTNVAQVLALLFCAVVIDRVGRRAWTVASFVIGGLLLAVLGLTGTGDVSAVMLLATLSYGVIGSANAVLYLYTPEVYPTRMRAIGTGLATSWLRLASAVGPTIVGLMVGAGGVASVFLLFAGVSAIGAVAATGMLDTHNRRLEDITP